MSVDHLILNLGYLEPRSSRCRLFLYHLDLDDRDHRLPDVRSVFRNVLVDVRRVEVPRVASSE